MKLIAEVQAAVALLLTADDVSPPDGVLQSDLVNYLGSAYQFQIRPVTPDGAPMPPVLIFQWGKLIREPDSYAIHQLALLQSGDIVTAKNTDAADIILDDLVTRADKDLRYRYGDRREPKLYLSSITVEFECPIEQRIQAFGKIESILKRETGRDDPFKPKTLSFGYGDPTKINLSDPILAVKQADFVLQRRAGSEYSQNRYFSSMPLRNADHVRVLQEIEDAMQS